MHAVLVVATLATVISFHQVDRRASILLLPHIGWTCYAGTLINMAVSGHEDQVLLVSTRAWQVAECAQAVQHRLLLPGC